MPPSTALNIITNAFYEAGAFAQSEVLPAGDAAFGTCCWRIVLAAGMAPLTQTRSLAEPLPSGLRED